jgi:hypothetical protein
MILIYFRCIQNPSLLCDSLGARVQVQQENIGLNQVTTPVTIIRPCHFWVTILFSGQVTIAATSWQSPFARVFNIENVSVVW